MWPLLKKDGLALQYFTLVALWNRAIGHNPFQQTTLKLFTLVSFLFLGCIFHCIDPVQVIYASIFVLHFAETIITPPARYPDLFPVLNAMLCAGVFGLSYLWSVKRLIELSWAMGSLRRTNSSPTSRANQVVSNNAQPHSSSIRTSALLAANPPRDRVQSLSAASTSDSLRRRNTAAGPDGHVVDLSSSPR
jgi:alpha-1,3-glucosyltransferase